MNTLRLTYFSVVCYLTEYAFGQTISGCASAEIQKLCLDQEVCDICLQAHVCCSWCYDETFTDRKCNTKNQLVGCNPKKIEKNSATTFKILENNNFTVIEDDTNLNNIIQMMPQKAHLKLRKGVPYNFTFTYKPAENYPLDLYYLGDLSLSMSQSLEVLKSIGKDLPGNLTQLTKNYRLAYGTFVDKPGMPFYFTDKDSINNPCYHELSECEKGYLFKHRLDFTKNTSTFLEKVESSELTANVDDLDGALDAILQILHCGDKISFSNSSRKIILLPTDSLLHTAGDGVLVGATLRPIEQCLLDENGEHSQPLKYDYPSLEVINLLLKQKKVNIIFAVKTQNKMYYYMNMTQDTLKGFAYVAQLEEDSKNILELIRNGFFSFAEQVTFYINTTSVENLDIKFFADCNNRNVFNETATCYNIKNEPIKFKVQISLPEIPKEKEKVTLYVEEKSINEKIELSIEYADFCKCENYEKKSNIMCTNGELRCGQCICKSGWTGDSCSEECNDFDENACRSIEDGIRSRVCNTNGECECGKCNCRPQFTGKYCEYECPSRRNAREIIVCGGPTKGKCNEGKCICEKGFSGEDCSCSTSEHECTFDESKICSDKGNCICNECKCEDNFTGKYCEKSKFGENNTICEAYESVIKLGLQENGKKEILKNNRTIKIIDQSQTDEFTFGEVTCVTTAFEGNSRCIYEYSYYQGEENNDIVILPARKTCMMTAGIKSIFLGGATLLAILVLGLLGIIGYKVKIYKQEKAEFERFKAEAKLSNELNPIYRSPVTEYSNPLRAKTD